MAETACCLATRSRSCRFRCANDLAEGGICQFEAETINSQPSWLSDNLGCVKGGDRGEFGCQEACNTNISTWDSFPKRRTSIFQKNGFKNVPAPVWFGYTRITQVVGFHLALLLVVIGVVKPASCFRELSILKLKHWTVSVQRAQKLAWV